jgi:4-amino-4-deoxy-L-arabinose transferase-like glycosyltransferase
MQTTFSPLSDSKDVAKRMSFSHPRLLTWAALLAIVLLADWLRFAHLETLGYGNHYYTAAVTSMLKSWHNFFFVAAEPGGAVSVDKPPLGLWVQAAFAAVLGVSGFSVMLPEILAGILSILVLYHLVRRTWGVVAGLLAALTLAITPVVVATDRNNTMDSQLILVLLLAAWAFIKATETGKLRHLLLGAALVGIGFNIKMLQAYLPLPAFFALYFLGSPERLWRKVGKLVLASGVLLLVSLAWVAVVELTPAEKRPYVGSSGDNSELSLIIGYNGIQRLLGSFGGRSRQAAEPSPGNPPAGRFQFPGNPPGDSGNNQPSQPGNPPSGFGDNRPQQFGNPPGGGRMGNLGETGLLRLFIAPLGKEVGWLLPLALLSLVGLAFSARLSWPIGEQHRTVVLWGGWLLTAGVFFSIAGFFHEYYLSILAPPLAALVGIGITQTWDLSKQKPRLAIALLLTASAITIGVQASIALAYRSSLDILLPSAGAFLISAFLLGVGIAWKNHRFTATGFGLIVLALFVLPGIWSALTMLNPNANASLPSAYDGELSDSTNRNNLQVNQALLDFLQENTQDMKYLMAVPSSMQGADYVIATERPVLYLGGFMGSDQVVTVEELAQMVKEGQLSYVYYSGDSRGGMGMQDSLASWVRTACTPVEGFDTLTRNTGTPDGTGDAAQAFGNLPISLYDCAP